MGAGLLRKPQMKEWPSYSSRPSTDIFVTLEKSFSLTAGDGALLNRSQKG
jgi:hypothetical protein